MQATSLMVVRRILKVAIVALALAAVITPVIHQEREEAMASATPQAASAASPRVIAYCFHTTFRCPTCRRIESLSREAIEQGFADALKGGRLQWGGG